MADTRTASASGRVILRLPAQPSPRPEAAVSEYARAYMLRLARKLAERNANRRALRRAELRARAFELVAADRLNRGGAA
jgi:phosphoglycerate dehydrogenase-like enzyme